MNLRHLLLPTALLAAGCGGERTPRAPAPPPAAVAPPAAPGVAPDIMLRGTVHLEPTLTFRSCESRTIVTALDSTGDRLVATYRLMRPSNEVGVYLLARGAPAGNGAVILREVEYATLPTAIEGCDQSPPNADIVAWGANPDWRLTIVGSGIEFSQTAEPAAIAFQATPSTGAGGAIRYEVPAGAGGAHTLQLDLTRAACNAGTGYTYGAMQASLVIDGKALRGCAWRTRLP